MCRDCVTVCVLCVGGWGRVDTCDTCNVLWWWCVLVVTGESVRTGE